MSSDDQKTDAGFDRYEDTNANGLMFLFFIGLTFLNPMVIIMNMNPMISVLQTLLGMLHQTWFDSFAIVLRVVMLACILLSILLGLGIYRLKPFAWKGSKIYIPILQIYYLLLTIPGYFIARSVSDAGLLTAQDMTLESRYADFTLRLLSSLIFTALSMAYLLLSRKGRKAIFGPEM